MTSNDYSTTVDQNYGVIFPQASVDSLYSSTNKNTVGDNDTIDSKYKRTRSIDFGQTKKTSIISLGQSKGYKLPTITA
jgi:hypothetical protein